MKKISADPSLFYRQILRMSLAMFVTAFLLILAAILSAMPLRAAEKVALTDAELSGVTGQAGISIYTSVAVRYTESVWKISDTDSATPQWLEFRNITVDDGSGGYFLIQTPSLDEPMTLDIGTNGDGRTLVSFKDYRQTSPRWYSVGDMVFCNQSLGAINLDAFTMGPSLYRFGAHADGTGGGFDFDFATRAYVQAFRYTYNTLPESLTANGIHLVRGATGALDNPADPSTWEFSGSDNTFRIGDIDAGTPAKIDIVTDTSAGTTTLVLNAPMEGSLRVENVVFGGNNFGPIAIDGIKAHRLTFEIR